MSVLELHSEGRDVIPKQNRWLRGQFLTVILLGIFGLVSGGAYLAFNNVYPIHVELRFSERWSQTKPEDSLYTLTIERFGRLKQKTARGSEDGLEFDIPVNTSDFQMRDVTDADITSLTVNGTTLQSFSAIPAFLKANQQKLIPTFVLLSAGIAAAADLMVALVIVLCFYPRARRINPKLKSIWLKLFLVLFSLNFFFNLCPNCGFGLGPSWIWGINRAADNACVYGRQVVFTYGPLGYLFEPYGYGYHFYEGFFLNAALVLLTLGLFAIYNRTDPDAWEKLAFFGFLWLFLFSFDSNEWTYNFLVLFVAMLLWELQERRWYFFGLSLLLAGLSGFALLLKFNSAVMAGGVASFLAVGLCFRNPKRFATFLLLYGIIYAAILITAIPVLFAGFQNFVQWFRLSWEIARGYNTVMARPSNGFYTLLALATLGIFVRLILHARKQDSRFWFLTILAAPYLFFAFKHGFVRADQHVRAYFSALPFAMGLLYLFSPPALIKTARTSFVATAFLGAIYLWAQYPSVLVIKSTVSNLYAVACFGSARQAALARQKQAFHGRAFTNWNATIGDSSIQVLPIDLLYADINHWPGWQPNPLFQLYSAYTPALDNFSASSLHGTNAPSFVMLKFSSIDNRNMFLDTPATWNTVLRNYLPLQHDINKALLEHKPGDAIPAFERTGDASCEFGETIKVPNSTNYVYARFSLEPTFAGRIWSFIFRGAMPDIVLHYQDGTEKRYRVAPETLATPVLISDVPDNLTHMLDLWLPKSALSLQVVSFKFVNGDSPRFFYRNRIKIEWLRASDREPMVENNRTPARLQVGREVKINAADDSARKLGILAPASILRTLRPKLPVISPNLLFGR